MHSLLWLVLFSTLSTGDEKEAYFREKVEPILRARCFECHSHETSVMKGGLTLDSKSGWEQGGDSGPAILPGMPEKSLVIQAIHYDGLEMPPTERLPVAEVEILTEWVRQGAIDPRQTKPAALADEKFWSLKPLVRPVVPETHGNPIDGFISKKHLELGLHFSPEASREVLIQRLYYDLLGLPPSPEEVAEFVADPSPTAYEDLVDELLQSPHYGERWARHWMDTIHFADSHGYEHDVGRDNAWPYRDYLIQAFNKDIPWDRFVREQLAADYFYPDDKHLTPALGFLGAGVFDLSTYRTATVTFDYLDRDDVVTQTMAALQSTTANCARCHAHKFDPISQEDYYAIQAIFSGMFKGDLAYDADPETSRKRKYLNELITKASALDPTLLETEELKEVIATWISQKGKPIPWQDFILASYLSTDGSTMTPTAENAVIVGGVRPDKDTYVVTGRANLATATALRLEVLIDDSLPKLGPGRQDNGNLHLNEIAIQYFESNKAPPREVKIATATADFNQEGWTISHAIDGNPGTAWGIYPAVGSPHRAVFTFAEPVQISADGYFTIQLKQLHGGGHNIGAFRLALTDQPAPTVSILPTEIEKALAVPAESRTPDEHIRIAAQAVREYASESISQLPKQAFVHGGGSSVYLPTGEGTRELITIPKPKPIHVLQRGDFDKPRQEVGPGSLSALKHAPARFDLSAGDSDTARRGALAEWIVHRDNVLTWRSAVNRIWHYHFGRGICDTPSDFGRMGGTPTHEELLDWLAIWFRDDSKGSMKALHRLIVTSQTYRQIAEVDSTMAAIDGDNRYLWRQNRQRLDADTFRDYAMAVTGSLDRTMGGPALQYFSRKPGIQATPFLEYSNFDWSQPGVCRRSIYRYVWRGIQDPFMEQLDFPDLGLLSPNRAFSASSLQALALFNNDFVLYQSTTFAKRLESESGDRATQIRRAVELCWLRVPEDREVKKYEAFVERHGLVNFCRLLLNSNEFLFVE